MGDFLGSLRNTVIAGFVLAVALIAITLAAKVTYGLQDAGFWRGAFRWFHVLCGIMWIGLLYYFNFVQIPRMKDIPANQKGAISQHIAPTALFWFRWGAMFTVITGLILAHLNGYLHEAMTFGALSGFANPRDAFIGTGMWLGIIMFLNVWLVIWPNQKLVLGMVAADDATKAQAAKTAMMFSRTNTLLSIPMLASMTMTQTFFGS